MGGLASVVRSAVECVRSQTATLQVEVTIEAWAGPPTGFGGADLYDNPVVVPGFVQEGEVHHKRADGQDIITKARISFLGCVPSNGAADRKEPIDPRDRITLPSGLSGHMAEIPGVMVDACTNEPFVRVVWIE